MNQRILQVDDDPMMLVYVGRILRTAGYEVVTATKGSEALERLESLHPDLVLLDVLMPDLDGYEVCRRIRRQPAFARLPILMLTGHNTLTERIKGFEAGADNYLSKPVNPEELQVLVKVLLQRQQMTLIAPKELARTIAVFSLRGGVGVSSVAVNLSAGLALLWNERVALVDLALANGQAALMLDVPPRNTWADLAHVPTEEIDAAMIDLVMQNHSSGVRVLAAPSRLELNELITGAKVSQVLNLLKATYCYLVLDLPHDFNEPSLAGLDSADQIILVVAPELASVRAASSALKVFASLNYPDERIKLCLNWTFERNGLARKEIESSLGQAFDIILPFAPDHFINAINTGVPPVISMAKGPLGALFEDVAFMFSREEQRSQRPENPSAAWQRLAQRARAARRNTLANAT
ncbi:MAG: response regulator [Candidatus Viridilinea halotolerans]|uniref:Response regulator n=1 Tax=Candidatus Viridilinea halotolerans TaxID=2491704 RepID=A0A426TU29_9CHLR|nr:MAG: response regulator [Candidatus Viridilinea halotolerans]